MALELALSKKKITPGWAKIGIILLAYATLYALNYWLPLNTSNYTTRIWAWSQMALTVLAFVILFQRRDQIKPHAVSLGLVLAVFSALSHSIHDSSLSASFQEGISV